MKTVYLCVDQILHFVGDNKYSCYLDASIFFSKDNMGVILSIAESNGDLFVI